MSVAAGPYPFRFTHPTPRHTKSIHRAPNLDLSTRERTSTRAHARTHAMACDARLLLPARLPSLLLRPMLRAPSATASTSPRCRILTVVRPCTPAPGRGGVAGRRWSRLRPRAAEAEPQGRLQRQDDVVDGNVLPYCSIDGKVKKSIGEMEQEFLQALQSFYYDKTAIMSNEEFDNLKEELMWEGSSVVMLSPDEQRLLEASMAYVSGNPIMTDAEFDDLKLRLKKEGSGIVTEGPRCSLRSRKVYSDLTVDYFKMFLLNVPAAVVALTLFFFLDDLTGFEITYLLELPEPFSFIFTWFAALPLIFWIAQAITSAILKDFLILKGPCPNCGNENLSFYGTILSVPSGGAKNKVKCSNCGTALEYDAGSRLITLPEGS